MTTELTIVTTTYNRKKELNNLLSSLKNQTSTNFKWLVMDDGSTDGTKDWIESISRRAYLEFEIQYVQLKNGGKHRALNRSHKYLDTKYLLVVDSDDVLVKNAVEIILDEWQVYKDDTTIGSLVFERGKTSIEDPFIEFPADRPVDSRYHFFQVNGFSGDAEDVFRTSVFKQFPFPEFEGEKFLSEGMLYYYSSRKYNSVFLNEVIAVGDYVPNGLTSNIRRNMVNSPRGTLFDASLGLGKDSNLRTRFKKAIIVNVISSQLGIRFRDRFTKKNRFLIIISELPSLFFKFRWTGKDDD